MSNQQTPPTNRQLEPTSDNTRAPKKTRQCVPRRLIFNDYTWEAHMQATEDNTSTNTATTQLEAIKTLRRRLNVILWHLSPLYMCQECDDSGILCPLCMASLKECSSRLNDLAEAEYHKSFTIAPPPSTPEDTEHINNPQ